MDILMSKHLTLEPTADEAAQIKAAIEELLKHIKSANDEMARDQREIETLRAQTRAILAKLKAA
jgi:uncharacterized protein involved in exopolysaccharide biosynthesis